MHFTLPVTMTIGLPVEAPFTTDWRSVKPMNALAEVFIKMSPKMWVSMLLTVN